MSQGPARRFRVRWADTLAMLGTSVLVGWFLCYLLMTTAS